MKGILIDLLACSLLLLACIVIVKANPLQNSVQGGNSVAKVKPKDDLNTATSREIVRYAKTAEILSNMNMKIDPCDDFYQYSCGNWHHGNPARLFGNLMTDRFQEISKAFDRRLKKLLREPENDNDLANKVKVFQRACKMARDDKTEYELSLQKVYKEFGELPVVVGAEQWNETSFKWWEIVARIQHKYGKQILLSVDIMSDIRNKSQTRVYIGPPDYDMSQGTKLINLLQEVGLSAELEKHLGIDFKLAAKTAAEMIEFERKLGNCGTDSRLGIELQDMLQLQSVESVTATHIEFLNIKRYLELVLGQQAPESVYIFDEKYLHNAFEIIDSTPKHVVANYVLWQLLTPFLVDDEKDITTWCLEKTKKYFGKFVDNWVYSNYKNPTGEEEIFEVFEDLRTTFQDALRGNKLDWISNTTREFAITKLAAMQLVINSYENENFTANLGELKVDPYHYVRNVQHVLELENQLVLRKLNTTNATTNEDPTVLAFTPIYNILENNIKIPVGFLQPRHFWCQDYPKAIRYATLGYLIGHEMIHGFDDEGRKFGNNGNEYTWWDPKSTYEFEERRKCFQAQYHSYKYGGKALPESVSQSENIADNAGVKLAYAAYLRWLNKQKTNDTEIENKEKLPGLSFNNRQLFFISFAQVWCEDVQSLFKSTVASADAHAPGMYRVIGSLSNFQEFSWVFKCNQDAKMDPEYKCSIY